MFYFVVLADCISDVDNWYIGKKKDSAFQNMRNDWPNEQYITIPKIQIKLASIRNFIGARITIFFFNFNKKMNADIDLSRKWKGWTVYKI